MKPLTARERRLVAIAILLAFVAVAWLAILSPLIDGFAARAAERDALRATSLANQRIAAQLPRWRSAAARQRRDVDQFAIRAPDPERAAEQLRERVVRTFESHQSVIQSAQGAPAPAGWVGVRVDARVQLEPLLRIIAQLENERPLIVVTTTTISADDAFETGRLDAMDVRIEVAAPFLALAER
jgi:type II secretory pathway component PulM